MKVFSKFKVLGVALATLVAVGITACGGGESSSKSSVREKTIEAIVKEFSKINGVIDKDMRVEFLRTETYSGQIGELADHSFINATQKVHFYNRHDPYKAEPEELSFSEFDITVNYIPTGAEKFKLEVQIGNSYRCYAWLPEGSIWTLTYAPIFNVKSGTKLKIYAVCGTQYDTGGYADTFIPSEIEVGESSPGRFTSYLTIPFAISGEL